MPTLINPLDRTYGKFFDGSSLSNLGIHVLNPNGAPNTPNAIWGDAKVTYYLDSTSVDSHALQTKVEFLGDVTTAVHF